MLRHVDRKRRLQLCTIPNLESEKQSSLSRGCRTLLTICFNFAHEAMVMTGATGFYVFSAVGQQPPDGHLEARRRRLHPRPVSGQTGQADSTAAAFSFSCSRHGTSTDRPIDDAVLDIPAHGCRFFPSALLDRIPCPHIESGLAGNAYSLERPWDIAVNRSRTGDAPNPATSK